MASQEVNSPYLGWPGRPRLSVRNQLSLGLLWFPSNIMWTALILIVMPAQVSVLVGPHAATAVLSATTLAGTAIAIVFAPVFGAMSDAWRSRLGRRRPMIIIGTIPAMAGVLLIVYAPTVALFVIGYLGLQFFNNFAQGAYQGFIPDLVPHEQRGAASGFMAFYQELGVIVGGILGAFTAPIFFGWAVALSTLAALGVTVGTVKEPPSLDAPAPRWKERFESFIVSGPVYRDFRWVWLTRLVVMTGLYVLETFLLYYLEYVLKIPAGTAKTDVFLILVALSVTSAISSLVAGYVSDRIKKRRIIVSSAGILQGLCALLFVFSQGFTTVLVAAALFGLGYGAYLSVDWALAVDTLPAGGAAKDMGLWGISLTLGEEIASFLGFIMAAAVIPAIGVVGGYRLLFAVAGLLFLIGSLMIWQVRKVA